MKKSVHTHSALIQNSLFRARIARIARNVAISTKSGKKVINRLKNKIAQLINR